MKTSAYRTSVRAMLAAGLLTVAGSAFAATATNTFALSANVNANCSVTATALAFGTVDPLSSQTDASSTVTVKCTKNTAYSVGLDAGTTSGATVAQRKLANGTDTMDYNVYTAADHATVWGNSAGSWQTGTGAGMGTSNDLTVYGRVASGQQNLAVGSFSDTVTVTVTY